MIQSLHDSIVSFTGIQDPLVADVVTGLLFVCGILMIVSILCKSVFRFFS